MLDNTKSGRGLWLVSGLSIASLGLWFWIGFPWQHHNESLVWAVELQRVTFWDVLSSNPLTPVQTYRPFGVGLAWLTFHGTNSGIWLQQIFNFAITAFAWMLALRAVENRLVFAWLSFLCAAGYFSGYIYLFHLHGVFYGPLFVYLAYLLNIDRREPPVTSRMVFWHLLLAIAVAFFHTFSLLFFAAFIAGRWLQNQLASRSSGLWAASIGIIAAGLLMKLLASDAPGLGEDSPILGSLATYRALELSPILSVLSAMLAVQVVFSVAVALRVQLLLLAGAIALLLVFVWLEIPLIIAWIMVCIIKSLWLRHTALAALIGVTALLPITTGTGSPTYALFTIMPCIVASIEGMKISAVITRRLQQAGMVTLVATLVAFIALKSQIQIPLVSNQVRALQAEKEKTQQLMSAFEWLDAHPGLQGDLRLCEPGDFPVRSSNAIVRTYRAPTHAWPFGEYVRARYGGRLTNKSPELLLCFGGQVVPDTSIVHEISGRWAGPVRLLSR